MLINYKKIILNILTALTVQQLCFCVFSFPASSEFLLRPISSKSSSETVKASLLLNKNSEEILNKNRNQNNRRIKRRLPFSQISKLFSKITGRAKVADSVDDVVVGVGGKLIVKNGADKIDDVIGPSKNLGNMPIRGMNRRQNYRPYEPPQFGSYNTKDEVQKARSKALSGANLALAAGGIAAGAWYFSGNHTSFITIVILFILISLLFAIAIIFYCFFRRKKRGYYAVNDTYALMSFVKKLLFYLF
uniref:Uncharacterized protein n=1 Tax=Meloidogyne hapla TaxID=6305 RepID=A0A1I8BLN4_MELHA